ncbi:MAG: M13 family metallopeptidase [Gemmatimonadota bacterium]|nr:M13 family metallopeptidase [Gemmatimonadota bacterium]HEU4988231.1 M13 family metallopeptidase [Gemmatimonadaceae bacterium]
MNRLLRLAVLAPALAAFALSGCAKPAANATPPLSRANLDTTCAPCTDFYEYANGGWLKRDTIPSAYPSYGSFFAVQDHNWDVLHTILDRDAADAKSGKLAAGTPAWKVGTYYASCMDTVAIDKQGLAPLQPVLQVIDAIQQPGDLENGMGMLEHLAGLAPWSDGAGQDAKDAAQEIAVLGQGGLTLPNKDYYTKTDDASKKIRDEFVAHVQRMFELMGDSSKVAAAEAKTVMAIEMRLAMASKAPVDLRDPNANYHKLSLPELDGLTPHFHWGPFFSAQGRPDVFTIDVGQPDFFKAIDAMFVSVPVADWRTYLRWRAVHAAAPALSTPFVEENFKFSQLFSGARENMPRWKRCINSTDGRLGELLGQEYVKAAFPPEAKARAVKIVDNLVSALHDRIQQLGWMSDSTKVQALAKLGAYMKKIGYPDKWRDYTALKVTPGDYLANVRAADQFNAAYDWNKIGKPVDRTEWGMTPPTVNAYYNPLMNEIVFPAGILQPPFYDPNADDAVNYGAMGAVIGHEMTHGFDDQGRQYDKDGNLKDWWTKDDAAKYTAEAAKVVKQFDGYTVLDSATHVNGQLTLGENIADFGGLTVAYAAMEKALGNGPRTKIDGFTPEQRFFLAWAQVWRELDRPAYARMLVSADVHAPAKWRVNGPLSNMPEFKAAWGCKDGDPMVRADSLRPKIW